MTAVLLTGSGVIANMYSVQSGVIASSQEDALYFSWNIISMRRTYISVTHGLI